MKHNVRCLLLSKQIWPIYVAGEDNKEIVLLKKMIPCFVLQTNRSVLFIEWKAACALERQGPSVLRFREKWLGLFLFLSQWKPLMQCTEIYSYCFLNIFSIRSKEKRLQREFVALVLQMCICSIPGSKIPRGSSSSTTGCFLSLTAKF